MSSKYLEDLKQQLVGDPDATFVFICNFEPERAWAAGTVGLPSAPAASVHQSVQRMEELGLLLAGGGDYLCLGQSVDAEYRAYLDGLGLELPTTLVSDDHASPRGTSEKILASPVMLRRLAEIANGRAYLLPMGVTRVEERIAEITGLRLALPTTSTMATVNSKIYSRRLTEEIGLRPVPGACCETVDQLASALTTWAAADENPVVVKDAYGVSGKGMVVIDRQHKADRLLRMLRRRSERDGNQSLHVVVERYVRKRCDLNYQFTVGRNGNQRFDFVKEALTDHGVHKGHVMPAALSEQQRAELVGAAQKLGPRLHVDGYVGVVGVDAILGRDGVVYPVLEINARLNMASYQGRLSEHFEVPGGVAMARFYQLRLSRLVAFREMRDVLTGTLIREPGDEGVVVTCFATVNVRDVDETPFEGRLHTMLFASDRARLRRLDRRVAASLKHFATQEGRECRAGETGTGHPGF